MLHLTDLDELIEKVRNRFVKEYISEALNAYRSGSYRASVSMTWVAVCIDIIEKIKELSNGGDKEAKIYHDKLNDITKISDKSQQAYEMMGFENNLIKSAEKLEFISFYEVEHLDRLKRDRNFSVHPMLQKDEKYITVIPEAARNHIVNACNILFIHPPTQGKILIETLFELVIGDSFPVDDVIAAKTILSSEYYLGRARSSLTKNFFICLLKELLIKNNSKRDIKVIKRLCLAINATAAISQKIVFETIKDSLPQLLVKIDDSGIKILLVLINKCPFMNIYLDSGIKFRLLQIVKTLSEKEIVELSIPSLADKDDKIKKELIERYGLFSDIEQKYILEKSVSKSLKEFAINHFINSSNFALACTNGNNILLPYSKLFDSNDLQKILEGSLANRYYKINQIFNSGGISKIFIKLFDETSNYLTYSVKNEKLWKEFLSKTQENYSDFYNDLTTHIEENLLPF